MFVAQFLAFAAEITSAVIEPWKMKFSIEEKPAESESSPGRFLFHIGCQNDPVRSASLRSCSTSRSSWK